MLGYLGWQRPGSKLALPFHTFDANGGSVTLTGLAAAGIEIYKGTSVVQRTSDNGITLIDTDGIDLDGLAGIHGYEVDLADNTQDGFYAPGPDLFRIIVNGLTVSTQTVRFVHALFRIGYETAMINTDIETLGTQVSFNLRDGAPDDDAYQGCPVVIHDKASGVQLGWTCVSNYTGATKLLEVSVATTFTITAGDFVSIMPPTLLPVTPGTRIFLDNSGDVRVGAYAATAQPAIADANGRAPADVQEWNSVALGTTNPLPNAAPGTSGGLPIEDANGRVAAKVEEWNGVALGTTNPLPNAAPSTNGGLPTEDANGDVSANVTKVKGVDAESLARACDAAIDCRVAASPTPTVNSFGIEAVGGGALTINDVRGASLTFLDRAGIANRGVGKVILTATQNGNVWELEIGNAGQTPPGTGYPSIPNVGDEGQIG